MVLRKAYGGGHFAMGGRPDPARLPLRLADRRDGLHGAGDRGPHRPPPPRWTRLLAEEGPEAATTALVAELTAEWVAESEPWEAAAHLSLDDVIEPGRHPAA